MERRVEILFWLVIAALVALFTAQVAAPRLPAGLGFSSPVDVRVACTVKLAFLLVGTVAAFRCAARLGLGNPARPPWIATALGLFSTLVGQANLARYQFSPRIEAPYPSLADFFYVTAYPFFFVALIGFVRAYALVGYPIGSLRERWRWAAGATAVAIVVALPLLLPVVRSPGLSGAKALNVAYPALDLILLIPTFLLLRASLPLRGGRVWLVWGALLTGFVFMGVGDVLFAYFSTLGIASVDPLLHATYIVSYGSLAVGVLRQHALLAS